MTDNNRKLDLIVRFERRARMKKILIGVALAVLAGSLLLYAQYQHLAQSQGG